MKTQRPWWKQARVVLGLIVLATLLIIGIDPSLVTSYGPWQPDPFHPSDFTVPPFPPSKLHWFGTDEYGQDIFTQIVYGIVPTLRDATILVIITLGASFTVAVAQTMYRVRWFVFDGLSYWTSIFPPVLLMLLILEIKPVYFSHWSQYWYYGVIGLFEIGRFVPIVSGDIGLIYNKPFIESARVTGGSQFWIFRRHIMPWMWPYVLEYIPSQYARILAVMGELGYFGVVTRATITASQGGEHFTTRQLDLPTLLSMGGHHWFTVPGGVFFPTIMLCMMIVSFRLIAAGMAAASTLERVQHWPFQQKASFWRRWASREVRNRRQPFPHFKDDMRGLK